MAQSRIISVLKFKLVQIVVFVVDILQEVRVLRVDFAHSDEEQRNE
jgi:hypothetical protein